MIARTRRGGAVTELLAVRPYMVTEGRVRGPLDVRLDTLVHQRVPASAAMRAMSTEERAILHRVGGEHLTVAEVSAHVHLPLGVTQVLVGDLATAGALGLGDTAAAHADALGHAGTADAVGRHAALDLLEEVSHGLSAL
jgi:hypothetical protein